MSLEIKKLGEDTSSYLKIRQNILQEMLKRL